jgi:hypothetical protein
MPNRNQARSINLGDLRAIAARSRGMGDAIPCLMGSGPLQDGQAYCDSATVGATVGPVCFTPLFPWVGNQILGSGPAVCAPVFSVPSPWNGLITVGVGALFLYKLFGGRR